MTTSELEGLTTQPAPVAPVEPPRRGVPQQRFVGARRAWRHLTSMRTALQLLFLLALAAVPGAFLPQRGLNPVRVREYFTQNPTLAPVLDRLFLFDVYASPWFAAVYLLLFVSLVGCLVPRIRMHARALRRKPPRAPANLRRLTFATSYQTTASPDEVLAAARRSLRRARWRTTAAPDAVSAEKGYLRETGNLAFHVSLVALLVGMAISGFYGFKGTVLLVEGDGFANEVLNYDDLTPGRRFDDGRLVPFSFRLDEFRATYGEEGMARTFDADIRWAAGAEPPTTPYTMQVNQPLEVAGAKTYLLGHGYAPRIVVRDAAGEVALDANVPCLPQDPRFLSTCTIKVPDVPGQQLGFEGTFTPTTALDPETGRLTSVHPAATDPSLTVIGFRGDLGLDTGEPQSVYELDTTRMTPLDDGRPQRLVPGEAWQLPGGGTLTYLETKEWATFQVTQDPGKLPVLGASVAMLIGLCLSLFVRRRRLWVRATAAGEGRTVVEVGGLARTGADAFSAEFDALAARLREAVPGHPGAPLEE